MSLILFRRHSQACLKTAALQKLSPELRKVYPHCQCGCWFSGTWGGRRYKRTSLHCGDWKQAEALLDAKASATTLADAAVSAAYPNIPLGVALERWYRNTQLAKHSDSTLDHHHRIGGELLELAGECRPLMEIDNEVISELQLKWVQRGIGNTTHRTYLSYLSGFFNFAKRPPQRWIKESPLPHSKDWPPKDAINREETMPLDPEGGDANYQKILAFLAAGPRVKENKQGRKPLPLRGNLEALGSFCKLMYEAGLRVSDTVMFEPNKLKLHPECAQYTFLPIKTRRGGRRCTTFLPLWLATELRALPMLTPGRPFFDGTTHQQVAASIRKELALVGEACGVEGVRPHRFRDSFAVNLLTGDKPVPIDTVSGYLGHKSVRTTEEYYAPWVTVRLEHARRLYVGSRKPETVANVIPFPRQA